MNDRELIDWSIVRGLRGLRWYIVENKSPDTGGGLLKRKFDNLSC